MSWAALTSGGKDSILSIQKAIDTGMDVRYLITARPKNRDSYMFHSSNLDVVRVIAKVPEWSMWKSKPKGAKRRNLPTLNPGFNLWISMA